jgi:hypothetical protein
VKLLALAALAAALVSIGAPAMARDDDYVWLELMCGMVGGEYDEVYDELPSGEVIVTQICQWNTEDGGSWMTSCTPGVGCIGGYSPFPVEPDIYRPEDPCELHPTTCHASSGVPSVPRANPLGGPEPSTAPEPTPAPTPEPGDDPGEDPEPGEDPTTPGPCQIAACQVPVEPTQYDPVDEPGPAPTPTPSPEPEPTVPPRCPKLLCLDDPIGP